MDPVAFLSYAHLDDAGSARELSLFHDQLQSELRTHTGLDARIFFDKKSISWGKRWASFIDQTLESAAFLVPILTPAFFQSESCRDEYWKFADSEKRIGRHDLVRPIYYVKCREMALKGDPLIDDILSRQYKDWRHLRHKPIQSTEVLLEFADLGSSMADTFFELQDATKLSSASKADKVQKDIASLTHMENLLDREITYDNVIAYAVEMFPNLPVSPKWTQALVQDINKDRYKCIRDIDKEVRFAKAKVDEFARSSPGLFRSSTDFITKSLIFVDADFRQAHNISPITRKAALDADITH